MHNKFCVIDSDIVLTGSYNWTNQAQRNDENITVQNAADPQKARADGAKPNSWSLKCA
ncbi:MAG: hypothetical protein EAZ97_05805 [Bacteroidetes bacterium]|nr:MAG: hypothetical protein EAZ97_05805 [Bacteroidota bacterium]